VDTIRLLSLALRNLANEQEHFGQLLQALRSYRQAAIYARKYFYTEPVAAEVMREFAAARDVRAVIVCVCVCVCV